MKPLDHQKILFHINLVITAVVFLLLAPTFKIYAWWFPDKEDTLWLFPLAVIVLSAGLWFLASLSIPFLIQKGWFEDRRQETRADPKIRIRYFKILMEISIFVVHMLMLVGFSATLIAFMRSDAFERMLVNLP